MGRKERREGGKEGVRKRKKFKKRKKNKIDGLGREEHDEVSEKK